MVQGYDLRIFYGRIEAVDGGAGRPAVDPAILIALWLYATSEEVGSAEELERRCTAAYMGRNHAAQTRPSYDMIA